MTREEKDILLKDLCARLPYGVKCYIEFNNGKIFHKRILMPIMIQDFKSYKYFKVIKPYLFPLSSMDKKQTHKFLSTCNGYCEYNWTEETFDWLNAHHFDWRGLIEKDLAIDATGLNIY